MSTDIRTLAVYFVRANRNATQAEAIEFAKERFPDSPDAIARFMADWVELRKRINSALNHEGDVSWEPDRRPQHRPVAVNRNDALRDGSRAELEE